MHLRHVTRKEGRNALKPHPFLKFICCIEVQLYCCPALPCPALCGCRTAPVRRESRSCILGAFPLGKHRTGGHWCCELWGLTLIQEMKPLTQWTAPWHQHTCWESSSFKAALDVKGVAKMIREVLCGCFYETVFIELLFITFFSLVILSVIAFQLLQKKGAEKIVAEVSPGASFVSSDQAVLSSAQNCKWNSWNWWVLSKGTKGEHKIWSPHLSKGSPCRQELFYLLGSL